jgi:hypothetical protein
MALTKLSYLDSTEVRSIAEPILSEKLLNYGFSNLTLEELKDFDGEYIFRINATVDQKVPVIQVIEIADIINRALRSVGELRFVNLSTQLKNPNFEEDHKEE